MRFAPLLLLIALLSAADREEFTLRDGRKLVGTYDEQTQTMRIDGGSFSVKSGDIVMRDVAPPEEAPKPKRVVVKPDAPAEAKPEVDQTPVGIAELPGAIAEKYQKEGSAAIIEIDKRRNRALLAAFLRIDTRPVPLPVLSKDPKLSELKTKEEIYELNNRLALIKEKADMYKSWKRSPQDERGFVEPSWFGASFDRLYAKYKLGITIPPRVP